MFYSIEPIAAAVESPQATTLNQVLFQNQLVSESYKRAAKQQNKTASAIVISFSTILYFIIAIHCGNNET